MAPSPVRQRSSPACRALGVFPTALLSEAGSAPMCASNTLGAQLVFKGAAQILPSFLFLALFLESPRSRPHE